MKSAIKTAAAAAVVLALGGCATSPNSSPDASVQAYVKDLITHDYKGLNQVLYLGPKDQYSADDYQNMDQKLEAFSRGLAAKVAAHGGLDRVKILDVQKEKQGDQELAKVTFVLIGKDGKQVDTPSTLVTIHTKEGWKVNPMAS
ncbi:MAG: hypothetical protein ACP5M3_05695 [Acidithiobacillus sp.]|uniref:hypothetical protein n=2 Tax=Acidithiobacillus sp. TaxID=1872118 RepID=UPI0025C5B430|nr:hypothetical protein [Acidithiobacillus sp.]